MVKIMENPIKIDDLGGGPIIFGNTHINPSKTRYTSQIHTADGFILFHTARKPEMFKTW